MMNARLKTLAKIFDKILNFGAALSSLLVLFMIFTTGYDVVVRYLGFTPPIWRLQFNEFALLWITYLASAWLLKKEGHVKVDIILFKLRPKGQALLNIFSSFICALFCLGVTLTSIGIVWNLYIRGVEDWGAITVPAFTVVCIIPVGSFMLFIQFMIRAYGYLDSLKLQ